jgi:hypothetical protein
MNRVDEVDGMLCVGCFGLHSLYLVHTVYKSPLSYSAFTMQRPHLRYYSAVEKNHRGADPFCPRAEAADDAENPYSHDTVLQGLPWRYGKFQSDLT